METSRTARAGAEGPDSVAEALRLAQILGGEPVLIPGQDVADTIIDYARANNITHVIVGKSRRSRWWQWISGSVTQNVINRGGGINIHVIEAPGEGQGVAPGEAARAAEAAARDAAPRQTTDFWPYAKSLLLVLAAIPLALGLRHFLNIANIALVFLTAILFCAVLFGRFPSLFACMAAVLAYNFFFLPPLYTFTIADPENVVALFFFAIVALIVSDLAARVRGQAVAARLRAKTTDDLYQFSRKLAVAVTLDDLLWATAHQIALMLKMRVVLLLPEDDRRPEDRSAASLSVLAGFPPEDVLAEADLAAAKWCWEKNRVTGRGSDTLPGAKWLFLPMRTGRGPVAVVGIVRDEPERAALMPSSGPLLTPDQQRLLDALADQAALAIERVTLARDLQAARLDAETDRLRSALLTSISHDLRTPLASILGSATSLASSGLSLDGPTRQALLMTIVEEADRLNRFIGNSAGHDPAGSRIRPALKPRGGADRTVGRPRGRFGASGKDPRPPRGDAGCRAWPADVEPGHGVV